MTAQQRHLRKIQQRKERVRRAKHRRRTAGTGLLRVLDLPAPEGGPLPDPLLAGRYELERLQFRAEAMLDEMGVEDPEAAGLSLEDAFQRALSAFDADAAMDPRWEAQELAYEAMQIEDDEEAASVASEALELDLDCADAMTCLADRGRLGTEDRLTLRYAAVMAAMHSLGEDYVRENTGHFWGLVRTRPLMRALDGLAAELVAHDRNEDAIRIYEGMLELNPNDNQGVRDPLLSLYLLEGELDTCRDLLQRYRSDHSAMFLWGEVLERYLASDLGGAAQARKVAAKQNPFVVPYLTGRKAPPKSPPPYYSPGAESEAEICASYLGRAWAAYPDAQQWLGAQA